MSVPSSHEPIPVVDPAQLPEHFDIAVIAQDADIHSFARDDAIRTYTNEMGQHAGFVRRMGRQIWKGNLFREYYIQKYTGEAEERILGEQSLHANATPQERTEAANATIGRFVSEYDETIHVSAGESRQWLDGTVDPVAERIVNGAKDLISRFTANSLNDDEFEEARQTFLDQLRSDPDLQDAITASRLYIDNLHNIARNVKAAVEHGADLDEALARVRVVTGESRAGVRTEAHYNRIDKVIDKVNSSRIGSLVARPTAVASAVSIAASVAKFGSQKVAAVAGMVVAPGVAGGILGGIKENKRIKDDRRQHSRERAQGGEYGAGAKRRDQMEETRYQTVSAADLAESLSSFSLDSDRRVREDLSDTEASSLLSFLAETVARTDFSDRTNQDFIQYSSETGVENDRLELDLSIARSKVALRHKLEEDGLDITRVGLETGEDLDAALNRLSETFIATTLQGDITEKDAAFASVRRKAVGKAAFKTALIGMGIGIATQETMALFGDGLNGLVEGYIGHKADVSANETFLKGMFSSESHTVPTALFEHHISGFNSHGDVTLPSGFELKPNGENTFDIFNGNGQSIATIHTKPDGTISDETLQMLSIRGLHVSDAPETIHEMTEVIRTITTNDPNEFLAQNGGEHVRVTGWMGNNTPAPNYDLNELGLDWGGDGRMGTDAAGNYYMSISGMTSHGSFQGAQSVDWIAENAHNDIRLFISTDDVSRGAGVGDITGTGIFIDVQTDPSGNIIIPAGSPASQLFSTDPSGHAVFHGRYVEVVDVDGVNAAGETQVQILATHIGENNAGPFTETVAEQVPTERTLHHYTFDMQEDNFIEMPPYIPITGRKPLEKLLNGETQTPPYYRTAEMSREEAERRNTRFSPRLRDNPEAELNEAEEIEWYFNQQTDAHRRRVRRNAESLGDIGDAVDVVITIPVAGHQEADNIYHTLEAYLDQTMARDRFELVLYVNNPETKVDGSPLNSDATLAEIERFKAEHPELPVRVFHETLARSDAKIGKIRKTLVDSVLLRHKDRLDAGSAKELTIVSNDADAVRVNPAYLETMFGKLKTDRKLDAVLGQLDWDNTAYVNYPEVHIGTRVFQLFDLMLRHKEDRIGANLGANAAFRASTYAAVGGYRLEWLGGGEVDIAEDVELGLDMRAGRYQAGVDPVGFGGVKASRIETSARRSIWTLLEHFDAPYNQWNYGFSADDDAVRDINVSDLTPRDFSDPIVRTKVAVDVEHIINQTLKELGPEGTAVSGSQSSPPLVLTQARAAYIERSLQFLGLAFEWNGSYQNIKITDASSMLDGLDAYAKRMERKVATDRGGAVIKLIGEIDNKTGAQRFRNEKGRFVSRADVAKQAYVKF